MDSLRTYWPEWTDTLRRLGLDGFAAWLLEAGGPINIVGAQLLYIGQPFVTSRAGVGFDALAKLLEQEDEVQAFVAFLRGSQSGESSLDETTRLKGQSL